jgi:D-alanyl-D-alanine carboxypeptidase (penicillin-binding protein 5/6)
MIIMRARIGAGGAGIRLALAATMLLAITVPAHPAFAKPARPAAAKPQAKVPAPLAQTVGPIDTEATRAFIIETETGAVLLDKGADDRIPTASLSKVMTAYVVFSMLKERKVKTTDELPVSEAAWRTGGSKMFVPLGSRITVENLLQGMIVQSGNDACVVLAEGLAGSQDAFVDLMNQKAKEIGLSNSHFADVDGLPNPDHYSTARDLATLAWRTIQDFPEYYHYYSEKDYRFGNIDQGNRNPLLYKDLGADGLKTGHTDEAGYSLIGSLHRGDRRIIMVLSGMPTMKARAEESERLAEWAFREYNDYKLFGAGDKVDDAQVWLGEQPKVPLTVHKDLVVTLPRKSRKDMQVSISYDQPIPAPVATGQQLGKITVSAPNVATVEVPLFAGAAVPRMGAFGRIAMQAAHLIWGDRH